MISKNKEEPSLQVEAKNDKSNSNHHSFSELTNQSNKEKNMQTFKATFKDDNNDSELMQNSNKTINYETSTIIKGPQSLNYFQLPRFFVIKSVDEENIHKVIKFIIYSQLSSEFGVVHIKVTKNFKKLLKKLIISTLFIFFLGSLFLIIV